MAEQDVIPNAPEENEAQELQRAYALHEHGHLEEAGAIYRRLIDANPANYHALHFLGTIEAARGRTAEAKMLMASSLATELPLFIENYAALLLKTNDFAGALWACEFGLRNKGENPRLLHISATALHGLKRFAAAVPRFDALLALRPDNVAALVNRGSALATMRDYQAALASFDKALELDSRLPLAHLGRGHVLTKLRSYDEAAAAFDRAQLLAPELAVVWHERGNWYFARPDYDEALACYDKAIALDPAFVGAWCGRARVLSAWKRYDEAFADLDRAQAVTSDRTEVWHERGNLHYSLKAFDQALIWYDSAIALNPAAAELWCNRGHTLRWLDRYQEAVDAYSRAMEIDPQLDEVKSSLLHQKMLICDWGGIERLTLDIERDIAAGRSPAEPFGWQAITGSEQSLQRCAELFVRRHCPERSTGGQRPPIAPDGRIRIAYCSGEFGMHATSLLLIGILEAHDRTQFEITAIDNGSDDGSVLRRRVDASIDRIISIGDISDDAAAARMADAGIDILVDLNGFCGINRMGVFAQRPASIQVNFLGYPGTLGAAYMDYIVADRHVIPERSRDYFAEKVVYLPHSYQSNDRSRQIGARVNRSDFGLPYQGFVFCCFNNCYKICPPVFDIWMDILRGVEGSVLWLFQETASAASVATNLRAQAVARGIEAERLVFAKRLPLADHLARHACADLFLDTLPCGAHTTASDALWAGLPLLTCRGSTFPGRVAASLLSTIGLPELIAEDLGSYGRLAVALAKDPARHAALRQKLAVNRLTSPLYDAARFTRHLEAAYRGMVERSLAGLAPHHFEVPDLPDVADPNSRPVA